MNSEIKKILTEKDSILKRILSFGEVSLPHREGEVFEDLVSCILDMQIRCRGKAVRYNRLKESVKGAVLTPEILLHLPKEALEYINMSRQKLATLYDLATLWEKNQWNDERWKSMNDEEVRKELSTIKGVGNWTIDMILFYTLNREDVFPVDDMHLKKAMISLYEIEQNEKKEMLEIAEDWRPYRSYGVISILDYVNKK